MDEGDSFRAFGHDLSGRVRAWRGDLASLADEGVTYEEWILDDDRGGPGLYRVRFTPTEIHRYVRGVVGWDQFLEGGLDAVADRALATEALASATERAGYDPGTQEGSVCAADFLGEDVEALVCGWRLDRADRVRSDVAEHDVVRTLHNIASSLPTAWRSMSGSASGRRVAIDSERDLQDVLFLVIRSVFSDARREEPIPSAAGGSKRADIAIPSALVLVEAKFVRSANHARTVADELRVDFESYHAHPSCGTVFAIVWDPHHHLKDPDQLERDLTAHRVKGDRAFDVAVRVAH